MSCWKVNIFKISISGYGKKTESYLKILEEETLKTGSSVSEIIKREHFDIAVRKITIGNCITSIKKMLYGGDFYGATRSILLWQKRRKMQQQ